MRSSLTFLLLGAAFIPSSLHAQTVLAHWDTPASVASTPATLAPDTVDACVTALETINTSGFSVRADGSESSNLPDYNANCYAGWTANINTNVYVEFSITFANDVSGSLTAINFDILDYGLAGGADPDKLAIRVFKNGSLTPIFTNDTAVSGITTSFVDHTVQLGTSLTSTVSTSDTYDVRLYAYDLTENTWNSLIGLDNIRLIGNVDCAAVPEPSSAMLLSLGAFGLLASRRRVANGVNKNIG